MAQKLNQPLGFGQFYNVINGKLTTTSKTTHGINPSTLEPNPEVPISTQEDVDNAVSAARAASTKWGDVPLSDRQAAVINFSKALLAQKEEFAVMLTKEQGKPLALARDEIDRGVRWLSTAAELPFPEEVVEDTSERRVVTQYIPLGVAVAIVPWNYPVMLACGKIGPALVAGNALIMKPSPFTSYCDLKLAELGQRFFPPGVFQALSGGDDLGPRLTEHPGVDKVSFTGSTSTGRRVMESCSRTLKSVTLELGGNDPAIVCGDVDVKATAAKIAQLALLNSGQVCVAIKRVYVHSSIYPEFLQALVDVTKQFLVGDGLGEGIFLGPIQNAMQYERVKGFLKEIKEQELKVATGSDSLNAAVTVGRGYFLNPVIVDNPPDDSRIVAEEPFGPVFPVIRWDTEEEVLRRANNTDMGLGASVWTKDPERVSRMVKSIKAGNVWVNSHMDLQPNATFGGHKQSGVGSEWGLNGLRSYCATQTVFLAKM